MSKAKKDWRHMTLDEFDTSPTPGSGSELDRVLGLDNPDVLKARQDAADKIPTMEELERKHVASKTKE